MATLTIRNLPEDLHKALKERAKTNRRSVNQEVIAELAAMDQRLQKERDFTVERIAALRSRITEFMTAKEIEDAKNQGRR